MYVYVCIASFLCSVDKLLWNNSTKIVKMLYSTSRPIKIQEYMYVCVCVRVCVCVCVCVGLYSLYNSWYNLILGII